jgi:hypothetical protein
MMAKPALAGPVSEGTWEAKRSKMENSSCRLPDLRSARIAGENGEVIDSPAFRFDRSKLLMLNEK